MTLEEKPKKKRSKLEFEDNPLEEVGDPDDSEEIAEEENLEEFEDNPLDEIGDDDGSVELDEDEDDFLSDENEDE